jgi:hypothetical protein
VCRKFDDSCHFVCGLSVGPFLDPAQAGARAALYCLSMLSCHLPEVRMH